METLFSSCKLWKRWRLFIHRKFWLGVILWVVLCNLGAAQAHQREMREESVTKSPSIPQTSASPTIQGRGSLIRPSVVQSAAWQTHWRSSDSSAATDTSNVNASRGSDSNLFMQRRTFGVSAASWTTWKPTLSSLASTEAITTGSVEHAKHLESSSWPKRTRDEAPQANAVVHGARNAPAADSEKQQAQPSVSLVAIQLPADSTVADTIDSTVSGTVHPTAGDETESSSVVVAATQVSAMDPFPKDVAQERLRSEQLLGSAPGASWSYDPESKPKASLEAAGLESPRAIDNSDSPESTVDAGSPMEIRSSLSESFRITGTQQAVNTTYGVSERNRTPNTATDSKQGPDATLWTQQERLGEGYKQQQQQEQEQQPQQHMEQQQHQQMPLPLDQRLPDPKPSILPPEDALLHMLGWPLDASILEEPTPEPVESAAPAPETDAHQAGVAWQAIQVIHQVLRLEEELRQLIPAPQTASALEGWWPELRERATSEVLRLTTRLQLHRVQVESLRITDRIAALTDEQPLREVQDLRERLQLFGKELNASFAAMMTLLDKGEQHPLALSLPQGRKPTAFQQLRQQLTRWHLDLYAEQMLLVSKLSATDTIAGERPRAPSRSRANVKDERAAPELLSGVQGSASAASEASQDVHGAEEPQEASSLKRFSMPTVQPDAQQRPVPSWISEVEALWRTQANVTAIVALLETTAATAESPDCFLASSVLARLYWSGDSVYGLKPNRTRATYHLERAVASGQADAHDLVATLLLWSSTTTAEHGSIPLGYAAAWRSAQSSVPHAGSKTPSSSSSSSSSTSTGERDRVAALLHWHRAANDGHPRAQLALAFRYLYGIGGLPEDCEQAVRFYRLAAAYLGQVDDDHHENDDGILRPTSSSREHASKNPMHPLADGQLDFTGTFSERGWFASQRLPLESFRLSLQDAQRIRRFAKRAPALWQRTAAATLAHEPAAAGLGSASWQPLDRPRRWLPDWLASLQQIAAARRNTPPELLETKPRFALETSMTLLPQVHADERELIQYYRHAADRGDVRAQVALGHVLLTGMAGHAPDYGRALQYLTRAAQTGDPHAHVLLASMYLHGLGVAPSNESALWHYRVAAARGEPSALNALGQLHRWGIAVQRDEHEAARLFRAAAAHGYSEAKYNLGLLYLSGAGVDRRDERQALVCMVEAARAGHRRAIWKAAALMQAGIAPSACVDIALSFRRVAEEAPLVRRSLERAQYLLELSGLVTTARLSRTRPRMLSRAVKAALVDEALWNVVQAAWAGVEVAQYNAAILLDAWMQDEQRALSFWLLASLNGQRQAMVAAGDLLYRWQEQQAASGDKSQVWFNEEVAAPSDPISAWMFYRQAAELGTAEALFNLGYLHLRGRGGAPRDLHLAERYLETARVVDAKEAWLASTLVLAWLQLERWQESVRWWRWRWLLSPWQRLLRYLQYVAVPSRRPAWARLSVVSGHRGELRGSLLVLLFIAIAAKWYLRRRRRRRRLARDPYPAQAGNPLIRPMHTMQHMHQE